MLSKTNLTNPIVSRLLPLNPYRIILFGSHAHGKADEDSDIDLLVVLDSASISQTYEERMRKRLMVRDRLHDINRRTAIDLIVYTKAEYTMLEREGTSFVNEIQRTGMVLYEKADERPA